MRRRKTRERGKKERRTFAKEEGTKRRSPERSSFSPGISRARKRRIERRTRQKRKNRERKTERDTI